MGDFGDLSSTWKIFADVARFLVVLGRAAADTTSSMIISLVRVQREGGGGHRPMAPKTV
jgi:hypothetical protein